MPVNDYECIKCEHVEEMDEKEDFLVAWCVHCMDYMRMRRVWTPPHTGRGSSGEPPR
jgi:hypothetical protein